MERRLTRGAKQWKILRSSTPKSGRGVDLKVFGTLDWWWEEVA